MGLFLIRKRLRKTLSQLMQRQKRNFLHINSIKKIFWRATKITPMINYLQ